jgi:Holliday junction resolvasome RuvABC endonuclease subunit
MTGTRRYNLVLAIYPNSRGFAFVLFEGSLAPVDWGLIDVRGRDKNKRCLRRISQLFGRYTPDALVLQDMSTGAHRAARIRDLNEATVALAETQGIPVLSYSREQVRQTFEQLGTVTKQTIAEAVAKHIPAFERLLPPMRKIWMSEDARMGIFDAAALVLAFYRSIARN